VFPKAYLKRHEIIKGAQINTIANRTLISDETNGKISDRAPADYIVDSDIIPLSKREQLLSPHFIDDQIIALMERATETLDYADAERLYENFVQEREAAILEEIRRACGVTMPTLVLSSKGVLDEVTPDVLAHDDGDDDDL
jgi:hypothetical protein